MRKIYSLLFITALALTLSLPLRTIAEKPIEILLNGKKMSLSTSPIIENTVPFIPFEEMFDALDFNVYWDDYYEEYDAFGYFTSFSFEPGSKKVLVGGDEVEFEAPSKIVNGTTYVPLSFIYTVAGKDVTWDSATNTISIMDSVVGDNIKSTDGKSIFEKLKSVDIRNATYTANISVRNQVENTMKRHYAFIEKGVSIFGPTTKTQLNGTMYYENMELDLDVFIQNNQQYRRNFVSGQWLIDDPAFIDFDPLVHVINYARSSWEKEIVDFKSGLNYNGLNLRITLNPDYYHKYISPKVTNSIATEIRITFYNMDPKTFVPNTVLFEYLEKDNGGRIDHMTTSYITIDSINNIKQITAPNDLKPLVK